MDISTIQKRKFLNNIYKLYLANGNKPSDEDVRRAFNAYFSRFDFGAPIDIDYQMLNASGTFDNEIINELMANSILNLEVLYDCLFENNNEIFKVINVLNNKMDRLKVRRKKLEDRVDQILFENSNSDGFFYSFSDQFTDLSGVDLTYSNAHVNIADNKVEIPKITAQYSNAVAVDRIVSSGITYSTRINGENIDTDRPLTEYEEMFDGLNDTYWSKELRTQSQSVVSLSLNIPITSQVQISKLSANLMMSSPVSIYARCIPSDTNLEEELFSKKSSSDYSQFSFNPSAAFYDRIILTFVKTEPDVILQSEYNPYSYRFGIRELIIGANYYDTRGLLVSQPISIPFDDNKSFEISSVAIDVEDSVPTGTKISYYVAADVPGATSVSDFNWNQIEPLNYFARENQKYVNLSSSKYVTKTIGSSGSDFLRIPLSQDDAIDSAINPVKIPYSNVIAYRIAYLDRDEEVMSPYILSGVNSFRHYGEIHTDYINSKILYKSPSYWSEKINMPYTSVLRSEIQDQLISTSTPLQNPSSGLFTTKIMCEKAQNVIHTLVKENYSYNLSVYLNGALIADLPSGTSSASIEWQFNAGINTIDIYYDKESSSIVSFNLMSGVSLNEYGSVFLDYYTYLDPIEFRRRCDSNISVFTIDDLFGQKQILASRDMETRSVIRYLSSSTDAITAVRYRAILSRLDNPLQTPVIDSIKVKFKHA